MRREPPAFRQVAVRRVEQRTPRLARVTLGGDALDGFTLDEPAASVRLLLPPPGGPLEIPTWTGNEFLLPDGSRPVLRTLTPRRFDPAQSELDVEVVLHGSGAASTWAGAAATGEESMVAVSGPGRGYSIDEATKRYVLAGDETAIPAVSQLVEALSRDAEVQVILEVADPSARLGLPRHPGVAVTWCDLPAGAPPGDALVAEVCRLAVDDGTRLWVAGEAAAVQRIRKWLFAEIGVPRSRATVRGYWKHGRAGDTGGDG